MKSKISISGSELLSQTIDWLRFPLMVAVVFVHMNPIVDMQNIDYSNFKSHDIFVIIASIGSHMIADLAVPCFFLFSGFLYFYRTSNWDFNVYKNKTQKRARTLIVPYLLWNVLAVLIVLLIEFAKFNGGMTKYLQSIWETGVFKIFWNYYEWDLDKTNLLGSVTPKYGPINIPLWFLRDLIVIVLISPIIFYFIKYSKFIGIIILGLAFYSKIWFVFPGFNITGIFFFSLGAYFSIHSKNMVTELNRNKVVWYSIAALSLILSTYFDGSRTNDFIHPIFNIFGVIAVVNLTSAFISRGSIRVNSTLSQASFFIFVTHTILLLGYCKRILIYIFPSEDAFFMLLKYFATPIITVSICILLYVLSKKFFPKITSILMGSR